MEITDVLKQIFFVKGKESLSNQKQITGMLLDSVVQFGEYDWLVLDVQPGKALLLTKDCVEKRKYHSIYSEITWTK